MLASNYHISSREDLRLARQLELIPDINQGFGETIDQRIVVIGRRRDPQPLQAARHGRIVDRLDIDAAIRQQQVARHLAFLVIADM